MELKEFVQKTIVDIVNAVEAAQEEVVRDVKLYDVGDKRTIEFDIAVTVEKVDKSEGHKDGKFDIRVLSISGGDEAVVESKNSHVTRIKFGVNVERWRKEEALKYEAGVIFPTPTKDWRNS